MKRILFAITIMAISANLSSPLFPVYETTYHLNPFILTTLFAIYALFLLPTLVVAGPLGDREGPERVARIGVIMALLSAILFAVSSHPWMLYVARIFEGIGLGAFLGTSTALLLQKTPSFDKERMLTLSSILTMIGFGLGPAISSLILEYIPWQSERLPYLFLFVALVSVIFILWQMPSADRNEEKRSPLQIRVGVPKSGRQRFWRFIGPAVFLQFSLNGIVISLIPTYVETVMHSTNLAWSGLLILLLLGGGGIASQIRWPAQPVHRVQLGTIATMLGGWLVLLAGLTESMGFLWIGISVQALGAGWSFPASMQLAGSISTSANRAQVISTFYVAAYSGMIFASLGAGLISLVLELLPALALLELLLAFLGLSILLAPNRLTCSTQTEKPTPL